MADRKITELTNITGANLADGDEFVVVDASADETKALTFAELKAGLDTATGFVRISGDTMTGNLDVGGTVTADGLTVDGTTSLQGGNVTINNNGAGSAVLEIGDTDDAGIIKLMRNGFNYIDTPATAGSFNIRTSTSLLRRMSVDNAGKINFYEDTGTTAKLHWDSEVEALRLGTTSNIGSLPLEVTPKSGYSLSAGFHTSESTSTIHFKSTGTTANYKVRVGAAADDFVVFAGGAERLRIDSGGLIRPVTSQTGDPTASTAYFYNRSGIGPTLSGYQFSVRTGSTPTERLRILNTGFVGIGNSSPTEKLAVDGSINSANQSANFNTGPYRVMMDIISSTKVARIGTIQGTNTPSGDQGTVTFYVNNSEKMRIDTDGFVGINNTSPATELDVSGTITADQYDNDEALPDVRPSLLLDFANSKTLDPRITFTRGSTATYWDGKTTHKAGENLFQYSQAHANAYWDSSRHTATGGQTAPDGSSTAFKWTQYSTDTTAGYFGHLSFAFQVGTFTFSGFFKAGSDGGHVLLDERSDTGQKRTFFNLGTGAVGTSDASHTASIQDYGNGWYRCSITFTVSSGSTSQLLFYFASADNQATATIPINGEAGFSWGLQYEENDDVLTYIPTTSAPIVQYQPTLQTAASGEARFDYDPVTGESKGLLIEEARTNLHLTSESATNHIGLNAMDVITNDAIAPDGIKSADFVYPTIGTQRHEIQPRWSSTSGVTYAFSAYIKAVGTVTEVSFSHTGGSAVTALFDLENGTVTNRGSQSGSYAEIEDAGNGWYRCILVGDATSSNSNYSMYISPSDGGETLGSGSTVFGSFAANRANGILIWGVQVEAGDFATSYIPTSGSTVTRSNDYAMISDLDLFERNKGFGTTLSVEGTARNNGLRGLLNFSAGNEVNFYGICETTGSVDGRLRASSTYDVINSTVTGLSAGEYFKSAMSINFLDKTSQTATNGTASSVDSSFQAQIPLRMTRLAIGTISSTTYLMNGHIKKAAVYPTAFNEATIKAMTKD